MPSPDIHPAEQSRAFWDDAAKRNAAWYVATGHAAESEQFFRQGGTEVENFLGFCGIVPGHEQRVLEIGCGVGRMTWRLAELFGHVTAVDISSEMLAHARKNLERYRNVDHLLVPGDGSLPGCEDSSHDVVFSYITLQHVANRRAQLRYLSESGRVLRPGGRLALQVRSGDRTSLVLEWLGHVAHALQGQSTLHRSWRGGRLGEKLIRETLDPSMEGGVDIRPWLQRPRFAPRHWWIVAKKA